MRVLCVSDLHIAGPDCPRQRAFLAFLAALAEEGNVDQLCLCGDVFQHWWHWPGSEGLVPLPQYAEVVDALRPFLPGRLVVLPGNHDWHVHEFFGALGATIPGDEGAVRAEWAGRRVLLAHGDQADVSVGYAALSALLRGSAFRAFVNAMSPGRAWRFLAWLAGHGEVRENSALIAAQVAWASRQPDDVVIYGHTHAPALLRVPRPEKPDQIVVNIGDGVTHGTFVAFDSALDDPLQIREFASPLHPRA